MFTVYFKFKHIVKLILVKLQYLHFLRIIQIDEMQIEQFLH